MYDILVIINYRKANKAITKNTKVIVMSVRAIVLDTETTGLEEPQVIELAYMPVLNDITFVLDDLACQRFKPNKKIEFEAIGVHGITDAMLRDQPNTKDIVSVMPMVDGAVCIIGHNIEYDINAIKNSIGHDIDFKFICTKRLALHAFPDERSYSLVNLVKRFTNKDAQSYLKAAHSAAADVVMTGLLMQSIANALKARDGKNYDVDALFELSESIGHTPYKNYF